MFSSGILPDRHTLGLGLVLLAGLLWAAVQNYLVFPPLMEILTVVATWAIFVTAWNSRYVVRNSYLSFIGTACLFVGLIDLLHVLSYESMRAFFADVNLKYQLHIIARCLHAVALVIAPFLFEKRFKVRTLYIFAAFSALTVALLLSVFYWRNFPTCFLEGTGPTAFLKMSQNAAILFFLASISTLSLKRSEFETGAFLALVISITLSMLSELAFTLNIFLLWPTDGAAHFLRLIAAYLMYRVFLKIGIFAPFNTIFRNLSSSEKNLFSLLEGLPAFVYVQMPDHRIQYANRVFRDLFGAPEGRTCHQILLGSDTPCMTCPTREIFRTGSPQQRDWGVIKGKTYAIYEYPYRDLNDSAAVLKLGIDITQRINMENELIASRDELEDRVRRRTAELTRANEALQLEMAERGRIQGSLGQSREELRLLSFRLLHAQEMERKRIAMELHDSLGGSLSAIKFRTEHAISQFDRSSNAEPLQLLDDIVEMLQNLIEEVRRIHSNVWPSVLSDFGLIMAINWHCRKFEENYPHIHVEKSLSLEESDAPDVLKIVVYRIIQESLNNVAKHSRAHRVNIGLAKQNGVIELKIRDNGEGFDVSKTQGSSRTNTGVGLSGMRERARLSGGSLEIMSGEIGTEIRAIWLAATISEQVTSK